MSALSHRSRSTVLGAIVAGLLLVAMPAAAGARPETHGNPAAPVNARGTDVAAPDQQVPTTFVRVTPVAPSQPAAGTDDSGPGLTLMALIALALGFTAIGYASWLAVSRKRRGAAV